MPARNFKKCGISSFRNPLPFALIDQVPSQSQHLEMVFQCLCSYRHFFQGEALLSAQNKHEISRGSIKRTPRMLDNETLDRKKEATLPFMGYPLSSCSSKIDSYMFTTWERIIPNIYVGRTFHLYSFRILFFSLSECTISIHFFRYRESGLYSLTRFRS